MKKTTKLNNIRKKLIQWNRKENGIIYWLRRERERERERERKWRDVSKWKCQVLLPSFLPFSLRSFLHLFLLPPFFVVFSPLLTYLTSSQPPPLSFPLLPSPPLSSSSYFQFSTYHSPCFSPSLPSIFPPHSLCKLTILLLPFLLPSFPLLLPSSLSSPAEEWKAEAGACQRGVWK